MALFAGLEKAKAIDCTILAPIKAPIIQLSFLIKEIAKLEEKYNINLNKEEEETMESVVIKVTVPRFVKKEVNDENISDM